MRLVDFVARFNHNKRCFASFIAIRSNPKPDTPSYYFRNVDYLNYIFKHLWLFSQMPMSSYESQFLQKLSDCLLQIRIHSTTSESQVTQKIQNYYLLNLGKGSIGFKVHYNRPHDSPKFPFK